MNLWMPTGLPALSSTKKSFGCLTSTGTPSRMSNLVSAMLPMTCSGGMP
jgi:hypothetical protein